jgi:hypothetical protein
MRTPSRLFTTAMQIFKNGLRGPLEWVSPDRGISNRYPDVVDGNEMASLLCFFGTLRRDLNNSAVVAILNLSR